MTPVIEYGFQQPTTQKSLTKCPLCEQDGVLVMAYLLDTGYAEWNCTYCGEAGDNVNGWDNKKALEQGYITYENIEAEVTDIYDNGLERGVTTGWQSLDENFTIRKGELTIITGIPNHGKSTFLNAMLINLMQLYDMKVGAYAPEHMPHKMHAADMMEKATGKPFWKWWGDRRLNVLEKSKAFAWLNDHMVWIWPKKKTITDILSTASLLIRKKKLDILVIDPWNRLETSRPPHMTETEFIGQSLSRISDFAKHNNICVFIVVHPHQMRSAKYEPGAAPQEPKPNAYSLAGSAHWNDMADNILSIWRDRTIEDNDLAEIHVLKVRWKITGKTGMQVLQYHHPSGRYMVNGKSELDKPPIKVQK